MEGYVMFWLAFLATQIPGPIGVYMLATLFALLYGVLDEQECAQSAFECGIWTGLLSLPLSVLVAHLHRVPTPSLFSSHPALI